MARRMSSCNPLTNVFAAVVAVIVAVIVAAAALREQPRQAAHQWVPKNATTRHLCRVCDSQALNPGTSCA